MRQRPGLAELVRQAVRLRNRVYLRQGTETRKIVRRGAILVCEDNHKREGKEPESVCGGRTVEGKSVGQQIYNAKQC